MSVNWKKLEGQSVEGKFALLEYVGAGERSGVFRTDHPGAPGMKAALKILPAEAATAESQLARWKHAEKFAHASLLKIYESGAAQLGDQKFIYVVEEFAEEDLSQILPERALTPNETRGMLGPVLDALAYLHGRGFVHGHLKPANIMAIGDRVKLSVNGAARDGEAGAGKGKLSPYDPPEAAGGRLTTASDMWSLGMSLAEVLTQRLPVWERLGQEEPRLPDAIPAPFAEIAARCLAREPLARWRVEEVAAKLAHKLSAAGEKLAPKPQPAPPMPKPAPVAPPPLSPPKPSAARPAPSVSKPATKSAPSPALPPAVRLPLDATKRNYLLAAGAVLLLVLGILETPRLLKHDPNARPAEIPSAEPAAAAGALPPREPSAESPKSKFEDKREPARKMEAAKVAAKRSPAPARQPAHTQPVKVGGVSVPGDVAHQVIPDVPPSALHTIHGTVRVSVRVRVDESGSVSDAAFDSPGPSRYFARLSMDAAKKWTFTPSNQNGEPAPGEWVLHFAYTDSAVHVQPIRTIPK